MGWLLCDMVIVWDGYCVRGLLCQRVIESEGYCVGGLLWKHYV